MASNRTKERSKKAIFDSNASAPNAFKKASIKSPSYSALSTELSSLTNDEAKVQLVKAEHLEKLLLSTSSVPAKQLTHYFKQKYQSKPSTSPRTTLKFKFTVYDHTCCIDSETDQKVSRIMDGQTVNYYDPELYHDLVQFCEADRDKFNTVMSIWEFVFVLNRNQLKLYPVSPLAFYYALVDEENTTLINSTMASMLNCVIQESGYQKSYLDFIMFKNMKLEHQSQVWINVLQICLSIEKFPLDISTKLVDSLSALAIDKFHLIGFDQKLELLQALISSLYDCKEFIEAMNYHLQNDLLYENCIYGSEEDILRRPHKKSEAMNDLKLMIKTRIDEGTGGWELGKVTNLLNMPFKSITYIFYPTEEYVVYCLCETNTDDRVWQVVTNISGLSETISGYSMPRLKNALGYIATKFKSNILIKNKSNYLVEAEEYTDEPEELQMLTRKHKLKESKYTLEDIPILERVKLAIQFIQEKCVESSYDKARIDVNDRDKNMRTKTYKQIADADNIKAITELFPQFIKQTFRPKGMIYFQLSGYISSVWGNYKTLEQYQSKLTEITDENEFLFYVVAVKANLVKYLKPKKH